MATKDDRRAGLILLVIALAGVMVRWVGVPVGPPGAVAFRSGGGPRPPRDSVLAGITRLSRPLGLGERIDMDRADASDLARLPRIGPSLAARIVRDRTDNGHFGSLEELRRVPGVGPVLLQAIRPYSAFSGRIPRRSEDGKVSLNTASVADLQQLPGIGETKARAIVEDRRLNGRYSTLEDLTRVPGVGRATIQRLRGRVKVR